MSATKLGLAVGLLAGFSSPILAAPSAYDFMAIVDQTEQSPINVGEVLYGSFWFDPAAVASTVTTWRYWQRPAGGAGLSLTYGAITVQVTDFVGIEVQDGVSEPVKTSDAFSMFAQGSAQIGLQLTDTTASVFTGTELPTFLRLDEFTAATFSIHDNTWDHDQIGFGLGRQLVGRILQLEARSVVPLPAPLWLLGAGFLSYLGLGYGRRRT